MLARFSLYDFIANIIPGAFFIWAISLCVDIGSLKQAISPSGGIAETSILGVVAYVTGLLLHGLSGQITQTVLIRRWGGWPSALWLLPENTKLTSEYKKELSDALSRKFGVTFESNPDETKSRKDTLHRNQEIFYRCYRSVEKLSDLPQVFSAQYGLFRSLLTVFGLLFAACIFKVLLFYLTGKIVALEIHIIAGLFLVAFIVSYWQVQRRAEDFVKSVYDVFLVHFGIHQQA